MNLDELQVYTCKTSKCAFVSPISPTFDVNREVNLSPALHVTITGNCGTLIELNIFFHLSKLLNKIKN